MITNWLETIFIGNVGSLDLCTIGCSVDVFSWGNDGWDQFASFLIGQIPQFASLLPLDSIAQFFAARKEYISKPRYAFANISIVFI